MGFETYMKYMKVASFPFGLHVMYPLDMRNRKAREEICNVLFIGAVVTINILAYAINFKTNMEEPLMQFKILIQFQGIRTLLNSLIILSVYPLNKAYTSVARKVLDIESRFKHLGISVQPSEYKARRATTLIALVTICSTLRYFLLRPKSTNYIICELIYKNFNIAVSFIVVSSMNYFCNYFTNRFDVMEKMLLAIKDDPYKNDMYTSSPLDILLGVSRIYEDIYDAVKHMNKYLTAPIMAIFVLDILQIIIIGRVLQKSFHYKVYIIDGSLIVIGGLFTLLESSVVRRKSNKLAPILAECDICYTDLSMSTAKNTFLLQQLHQDIQVSFFGFLELSLRNYFDHLSRGITLVIFIFELASQYSKS